MNKWIGHGWFFGDPRSDSNGVCYFTLKMKKGKRTMSDELPYDFANCFCYDKDAEFVLKNFNSGKEALMEGRIVSIKDQDSGKFYNRVLVNRLEFCGPKTVGPPSIFNPDEDKAAW